MTATPNTGYHFVSWSDAYPTAARTDLNVTANLNVTATFALDTFTLNYTAGPGGSIVGHEPPDGQLRHGRYAGDRDAEHRVPLRELERCVPDPRAD